MEPIKNKIHRKPIIVAPEISAEQAARIMSEKNTGSLLVARGDGELLGLITDRDLARHALGRPTLPISTWLRKPLVTIDENATLTEALSFMEQAGVRRLPVIHKKDGGRMLCIGLVTLDDLIASESIDIRQAASVVRRQMIHRTERSLTRRKQTLQHFYSRLAATIGVSEQTAARLALTVFSALIQRLSFTGAAHLLSQLPSRLQEELLIVPPGPNRNITLGSLLTDIMNEMNLDESAARIAMIKIFSAISEMLDPGEIDHVKSQLPEELRALFVGPERARSKLAAA